jgi:CubicO group peptidase (beta-lactamase class C family)
LGQPQAHKEGIMKLQKVTDTIERLVKNMKHNGSLLISNEKEIVYKKCFGYADIEKKMPISFKTQFLAGSVTKQFAAVAILKALLNKQKKDIKLELNKSIQYFLPEEHEIWDGTMPDWANKVTIHQLLVHSSGIPNYTSLPEFEHQRFPKNSEIINFFKGHELEFSPGEKFSYSNSGYYLLGIIIEEIVQQNLDVYLEKNFFEPLEMKSTFLPMQGTVDELIHKDARFVNLARGYQYDMATHNASLEEIKRYERMEVPGAAGSLITTVEDL